MLNQMTEGRWVLVHGVSWSTGTPLLTISLDPTGAGHHTNVPLVDERLAFRLDPTGRFCTGAFTFPTSATGRGRREPCVDGRLAVVGAQCERCAARDESRFMHHVHRGGHVPPSLEQYLAQPHWLYVATFADGTSKVGTASDARKRIRLDEQGAVRATYIARAADGYQVRTLEDRVTEHAGISQTKHKSAKLAALAHPVAGKTLDAAHADAVEAALTALDGYDVERPLERWAPPTLHTRFFSYTGVLPQYSHPLMSGTHCLTPHALVGGVAVVSLNEESDVVLVDLDSLRGRRLKYDPEARSPSSVVQHSLF